MSNDIRFEWVGEEFDGHRKFLLSLEDCKSAKIVRLKHPLEEETAYRICRAIREGIRDIAVQKTGNVRAYDNLLQSVVDQVK